MEAIYEFTVEDMPVTVAVDSEGNNVHQIAPLVWKEKIAKEGCLRSRHFDQLPTPSDRDGWPSLLGRFNSVLMLKRNEAPYANMGEDVAADSAAWRVCLWLRLRRRSRAVGLLLPVYYPAIGSHRQC